MGGNPRFLGECKSELTHAFRCKSQPSDIPEDFQFCKPISWLK
jgi:hypothetical protein